MDITKLLEEIENLEDYISFKKLETLDDVIKSLANAKIEEDKLDELIEETILTATENHASVVKLWNDIEGDTENDEEIIKLMLADLREYIPEKVKELRA